MVGATGIFGEVQAGIAGMIGDIIEIERAKAALSEFADIRVIGSAAADGIAGRPAADDVTASLRGDTAPSFRVGWAFTWMMARLLPGSI
jgi:hypothetical protein